jgi:hypothetical protein
MSPQDLFDLLRSRPFIPFRIYATDGRTHGVRHSDQVLVLRTRIIQPFARRKSRAKSQRRKVRYLPGKKFSRVSLRLCANHSAICQA